MPGKASRICRCGHVVASGVRCPCERKADAARKVQFDKTRPNSSARGYNGTWEKARKEYLIRKPVCIMCGAIAKVVDHIKPHKGDLVSFWDKSNWQSLCSNCHNSKKQRMERNNP